MPTFRQSGYKQRNVDQDKYFITDFVYGVHKFKFFFKDGEINTDNN